MDDIIVEWRDDGAGFVNQYGLGDAMAGRFRRHKNAASNKAFLRLELQAD